MAGEELSLVSIEHERCPQCRGRLCTRIGSVACTVCGLPWTPPKAEPPGGTKEPSEPTEPPAAVEPQPAAGPGVQLPPGDRAAPPAAGGTSEPPAREETPGKKKGK